MAGRAAEEIDLSIVSSGAGGSETSDLALATKLAIDCVTRFGLSKHGLAPWIDPNNYKDLRYYPKEIQDEVGQMLTGAYEEAKALLQSDGAFLRTLTGALLERTALAHADILALDPTNKPCSDFNRFRPGHGIYHPRPPRHNRPKRR